MASELGLTLETDDCSPNPPPGRGPELGQGQDLSALGVGSWMGLELGLRLDSLPRVLRLGVMPGLGCWDFSSLLEPGDMAEGLLEVCSLLYPL